MKQLIIELKDRTCGHLLPVYVNIHDNSLSRKWLSALNELIQKQYHLEKNYCFFGFAQGDRPAELLCQLINKSIDHINQSSVNYEIDTDPFTVDSVILHDLSINHDRMNQLHRWFEDLQGWDGNISSHYNSADSVTRWHIRQLNLLCHELESLVLSLRKLKQAPDWQRPSQLMCWLNAPKFKLDSEDFELFGIDTIARPLGGVYVGVNKAVGKHHWEVFHDEGRDSRIQELTTSGLRSQTLASGDFDIEWGQNPDGHPWMYKELNDFRNWLINNGFDPNDKSLTIGHPQVGQIDLIKSFNSEDYREIWQQLNTHLDVYSVSTNDANCVYEYHWSDLDYVEKQVNYLSKGLL